MFQPHFLLILIIRLILKISFDSKILRDTCENYETAIEEFGVDSALILFRRLSDIEGATNFSDIGIGHSIIKQEKKNQIIINYYFNKDESQYLTFEIPENNKLIRDFESKQIITRIKLIEIQL